MWEYYHAYLPAKIPSEKGPLSFDNIGQGPNALSAQHNAYTSQLGQQGWELVSAMPISLTDGITAGIYMIFKRPLRT